MLGIRTGPYGPTTSLPEPLSKLQDLKSVGWGLQFILRLAFPKPKVGPFAQPPLPMLGWTLTPSPQVGRDLLLDRKARSHDLGADPCEGMAEMQ